MYQVFDCQHIPIPSGSNLLYLSHHQFERQMVSGRHSHECTELSFCIHGSGEFMVRDSIIPVQSGDFMIIPPMVEHGERSTAENPLEYVVIGLSNISVSLANASVGFYKGNFNSKQMLIFTLLSTLIEELEQKQLNYQNVICSTLNILLTQITRLSAGTMNLGTDSSHASHLSDHSIFWVKQYIDDNFTKDINLDLLSSKIGLNKYSLIRKFKLAYGISPINYLLERKFEEARFLLQTTENSIKQISQSVGFSSASYFAQSFTRHEGISPTEYRQAHR